MTKALEQVIERLKLMPEDRRESFARLLMREINEDERWRASTAEHADKLKEFVESMPRHR
jgi:predicted protein tyrosine phosphatase